MYGIDVRPDYKGEIPQGMEAIDIPESAYAVFHHPPFDYNTMEMEVFNALVEAMENWKPAEHGYVWNDALPTYQRHNPPKYGEAHLRPVKKTA
jgi:predicted transcriptional regulator YdeE